MMAVYIVKFFKALYQRIMMTLLQLNYCNWESLYGRMLIEKI